MPSSPNAAQAGSAAATHAAADAGTDAPATNTLTFLALHEGVVPRKRGEEPTAPSPTDADNKRIAKAKFADYLAQTGRTPAAVRTALNRYCASSDYAAELHRLAGKPGWYWQVSSVGDVHVLDANRDIVFFAPSALRPVENGAMQLIADVRMEDGALYFAFTSAVRAAAVPVAGGGGQHQALATELDDDCPDGESAAAIVFGPVPLGILRRPMATLPKLASVRISRAQSVWARPIAGNPRSMELTFPAEGLQSTRFIKFRTQAPPYLQLQQIGSFFQSVDGEAVQIHYVDNSKGPDWDVANCGLKRWPTIRTFNFTTGAAVPSLDTTPVVGHRANDALYFDGSNFRERRSAAAVGPLLTSDTPAADGTTIQKVLSFDDARALALVVKHLGAKLPSDKRVREYALVDVRSGATLATTDGAISDAIQPPTLAGRLANAVDNIELVPGFDAVYLPNAGQIVPYRISQSKLLFDESCVHYDDEQIATCPRPFVPHVKQTALPPLPLPTWVTRSLLAAVPTTPWLFERRSGPFDDSSLLDSEGGHIALGKGWFVPWEACSLVKK